MARNGEHDGRDDGRDSTAQQPRSSTSGHVSSSARWQDALVMQQLKTSADDADAGQNSPAARWHRACFYARRLIDDPPHAPGMDEWADGAGETVHKRMEEKYWLEMIDRKHRKASNLNRYHAHWNTQYDGDQNFFHWLDHGEGKDVDIEECPRDRLEKQCVIYLSAEQRLNYLVKVAEDGKLVWARNGRPVDTARGKHKDLGNGQGIVDVDDSAPDDEATDTADEAPIVSDDDSSGLVDLGVGHQALHPPSTVRNVLARFKAIKPSAPKPVRKRKERQKAHEIAQGLHPAKGPKTWMFVVDARANLYVGMKQAGRFQHSSFLFGARVMAAGLIKVRAGALTSLMPLSGHYKAGTPHFKRFVELLRAAGCDMSHVSISAGLVTIGAVEHYGRFSKTLHGLSSLFRPSAAKKETADDKQPERVQARKMWDKAPLPHEGKRREDMSDAERVERGTALVARAMARGLARRDEADPRATSQGSKQSSISPDADLAAQGLKRDDGVWTDGEATRRDSQPAP